MKLGWGTIAFFAIHGKSPRESIAKALKYAQKALSLNESSAITHGILGNVYLLMRKYEKAIPSGERAVELEPSGADVHVLLGSTLGYAGSLDEAIGHLYQGIRLNPFPPSWYFMHLGRCYRQKGQYEEALAAFEKALQRSPEDIHNHMSLAAVYAQLDRQDEAEAAGQKVLEINPKFAIKSASKAWPYKNPADLNKMVDALRKSGLPYEPSISLSEKPSIAVLPFDNLSDDPEQEYFSDGLAEEIITTLAKVPDLIVIARNSTFTYKGKPVKIQQVAKDLGVRYVLEGSVRKGQSEVRITAQLIDASTGHHLWAERYDRSIEDIFDVQDEIALNILNAVEVKFTHGEQALLRRRGTNNIQVYLKLLQGIHYDINLNPSDNLKAKKIYEEIIKQEPDYAYPYIELAGAHLLEVWLGISDSPKESYQKAAGFAKKALTIDDSLGLAYALLGSILIQNKDWDRGVSLINKGIELEPSRADSYWLLGGGLCFADRLEEAFPILEKAIQLNPIAPATYLNAMAIAYRMIGQYEKAIEFLEKATQKSPNYIFAHLNLSACYILTDRAQEAHAEAKEVLRLNPKFSIDQFEKVLPLKNQEEKNRFIGALRKAFFVQGDS